jgi:hypothetical protein
MSRSHTTGGIVARIDGIVILRGNQYNDGEHVMAIVDGESSIIPTIRMLAQREIEEVLEGYEPNERVEVRLSYRSQRVSSIV